MTAARPLPGRHRRLSLPAMLALFAGLAAFVAPTAALASDGQVQLAIRPIDQAGQFFDLTMRPGETRTFGVELANVGDAALAARTYAADVYTIINGGFGARLRDEPQTGTTLWLDYSTDVLQLPAGEGIRRTFSIAVPADAEPGEYITSLVLENDVPIRGSGDVAIDQVVRQATAVVVTVPGRRSPAARTAIAGRSPRAAASPRASRTRRQCRRRIRNCRNLLCQSSSEAIRWHPRCGSSSPEGRGSWGAGSRPPGSRRATRSRC